METRFCNISESRVSGQPIPMETKFCNIFVPICLFYSVCVKCPWTSLLFLGARKKSGSILSKLNEVNEAQTVLRHKQQELQGIENELAGLQRTVQR